MASYHALWDYLKNEALGAIVLCVNASKTCYATIAFIFKNYMHTRRAAQRAPRKYR